jgi:UDP-glucose 4-epimerase
MNVLVTGGAGFIGTNLIKNLLQKKYQVYSIDNYSTGSKINHQIGCTYIEDDIKNITNYNHINPDVIFHLAAISRIQPSFKRPKDYFDVNANGTLCLSEWCVKNNIPLIYAGSSSKHNGKFKNPYTFSKDIGEEIIMLYQHHYNLQSTIARFYNVYGSHQLLEGGYTTLIGRWINNINNNLPCVIYGDGEQRRDFTHVDDIVDALILIMEKKAYGYEFELGRGKNYSVNEVAEMFDITPVYDLPKEGEAKETLNTSIKAKTILDWEPKKELFDYIKSLNENNI